MNKYKYNYSKLVLTLIILGIPLALACIVMNVLRLIKSYADFNAYNYASVFVVIAVSIAYLVIAIALLIDSSYYVTDKHFVLKWGVLKNEIELKSITRIVYNTATDKLAIYYNDDNFFMLNAKNVNYGELAEIINEKNNRVVFEMISEEIHKD